jgi:hypothetical protein
MKMQRGFLSFTGIALLFASALFAQQVKTDYDRERRFQPVQNVLLGKGSTPKTICGSIGSKRPSIPH